ncbi:MAG: NADH:flavin oxidoreductase [Actinomycetota bacterium]|nr:NADH:flavin oxidoreductase [Actinomycetota bacterium]
MRRSISQVRSLKTVGELRAHLVELGVDLPVGDAVSPAPEGPLAQPLDLGDGLVAGNRFAVLPMEGWDGTAEGLPTDLVERRWERFGSSGAKLVWGGEAVAVRHDGRANPRQLTITSERQAEALDSLRQRLVKVHVEEHGRSDDLVVGLQLTHSGRFARPDDDGPRPQIAYHHPVLDNRLTGGAPPEILSDGQLDSLAGDFVAAAVRAEAAGFAFVDVKACHGYLGHELLSAIDRPGIYGGDLSGRSRFLRQVIAGIRSAVPGLGIGVRLSVFDFVPMHTGVDGVGVPEATAGGAPYRHAFGGDGTGTGVDLAEVIDLIDLLHPLDVRMICVTGGSPYYSPHIQRPAYFPPSDGYDPPEDPLVGVARLIGAATEIKRRRPSTVVIGSGYSYLQEWLPNVAEAVIAAGDADAIGVGRMVLSYPTLPADVLAGRTLDRRHLCRTFSDCTTAPRAGLVSGCYPLDEAYKSRPERSTLVAVKRKARSV